MLHLNQFKCNFSFLLIFSESCGADHFRCQNGKCIEGYRRCDRVVDCPSGEDEVACGEIFLTQLTLTP